MRNRKTLSRLVFWTLLLLSVCLNLPLAMSGEIRELKSEKDVTCHDLPSSELPLLQSLALKQGIAAAARARLNRPLCDDRLREACTRLANAPRGVLRNNPDGTIDANPITLTRDWPAEHRDLLALNHQDRRNFEQGIRPLFNRLLATLRRQIETMPSNHPMRAHLLDRISHITLEVADSERCQRPNRVPFIARTGQNQVIVCPLLTHVRPITLATALAHELSHIIDLCRQERAEAPQLDGYPYAHIMRCTSRVPEQGPATLRPTSPIARCDRDDEIFADYTGAAIVSATFRSNEFTMGDPVSAAIEYESFRMINACAQVQGYEYYLPPLVQTGFANRILGCSGFNVEAPCSRLVSH